MLKLHLWLFRWETKNIASLWKLSPYYAKTMSQRRFDVIMTLLLRHVSAGGSGACIIHKPSIST